MSHTPTYITKNRLGIYYFQYAIPKQIPNNDSPSSRKIFRKTLHTRVRREARNKALYLFMTLQKLRELYFNNDNDYERAMKLLMKYDEIVTNPSWEVVENFLMGFEGYEAGLLQAAVDYSIERDSLDSAKDIQIKHLKEMVQALTAKSSNSSSTVNKDSPLLDQLLQEWMILKSPGWAPSSLTSAKCHVKTFEGIIKEVHGDKVVFNQIDPTLINHFKKTLKNLPPSRSSAAMQKLTYAQLVDLPGKKLSDKTFRNHINTISDFLKWAIAHGHGLHSNSLTALIYTPIKISIPVKNRTVFSESDIELFFSSDQYAKGLSKRESDYWVPLIALFTGARLAEICQMHLSDINFIDNVWVFDINNEEEKRLKNTKSSVRKIPIHPKLISMGFIEYCDFLKKQNKSHVFPTEVRSPDGKFSRFSKRFANYLKAAGVHSTNALSKDFHSFRHTVRTKLTDLSVEENIIDSILGHESKDSSVGRTTYTHTELLPQKNNGIKKLNYDFDFVKKIKNWKYCSFMTIKI